MSSQTVFFPNGELWVVDLAAGRSEQLLPGIRVTGYDVSRDDRRVVFTAPDASGHSRLWNAPLDHRTAPRQLPGVDIVQPRFGRNGDLVFVAAEGTLNYLYRSGRGSGRVRGDGRSGLNFTGCRRIGSGRSSGALLPARNPRRRPAP